MTKHGINVWAESTQGSTLPSVIPRLVTRRIEWLGAGHPGTARLMELTHFSFLCYQPHQIEECGRYPPGNNGQKREVQRFYYSVKPCPNHDV